MAHLDSFPNEENPDLNEKMRIGPKEPEKEVQQVEKRELPWKERIEKAARVLLAENEEGLSPDELGMAGLDQSDLLDGQSSLEHITSEEVLRQAPKAEIFQFARENPDQAFDLFFTKEGEEYTVDFHGVDEHLLGLGHFDAFTKKFPFASVNGRVGGRGMVEGANQPGYFRGPDYLEIFSGDKVKGFAELPESEAKGESAALFENTEMDWDTWNTKAQDLHTSYAQEVTNQDQALQEMETILAENGITSENMSDNQVFQKAADILAQQIEERYGIPHEVVLAQSFLETGGGRHLSGGYNYFGIKGKGKELLTTEFEDGVGEKVQAQFRTYNSMVESFNDYAVFLSRPRYRKAFKHKENPRAFLQAVVDAGYATDPKYMEKAESALGQYQKDYSLDQEV